MFESKTKVNRWVECGDDYYFGRDGEKVDYEMASIFYHKAVKKKHPRAAYMLGLCHELGRGVDKDMEYAKILYEQAAQYGDMAAKKRLASGTFIESSEADAPQASSDALAQHDAAVMYYNGIGTSVDFRKAFVLFEKSAVQGDPAAQFSLARLYENGEGTERNERQAVKWMTMAAEQGYTDAQLSLGYYYMPGGIAEEDYDHALFWIDKAAISGNADAEEVIGDYRVTYNNGSRLQSTLRSIGSYSRVTSGILKEKIKERGGERPFDVLALSFLLIRLDRGTDCLYNRNIVRAYLSDLLPGNQGFQNLAALLYDTDAIAHLKNEVPDISVIVKKLTDAGAGVYEAETLVRCFMDTLAWNRTRKDRQKSEG
jgi:TPR repeat protein